MEYFLVICSFVSLLFCNFWYNFKHNFGKDTQIWNKWWTGDGQELCWAKDGRAYKIYFRIIRRKLKIDLFKIDCI